MGGTAPLFMKFMYTGRSVTYFFDGCSTVSKASEEDAIRSFKMGSKKLNNASPSLLIVHRFFRLLQTYEFMFIQIGITRTNSSYKHAFEFINKSSFRFTTVIPLHFPTFSSLQ